MTAVRAPSVGAEDDIGRSLGLVAPGVWFLFGLYVVSFGFNALVLGGKPAHTPYGFVALGLDFAGAAIIVSSRRTPLPLWRAASIVGIVSATVILISSQQVYTDHLQGYEGWELGANNLLMAGLAIRGRVIPAWIAEVTSTLLICIWNVMVGSSFQNGIAMTYGQAINLLACTAFAIGLQRTGRRILDFRAAERERAARQSLAESADQEDEVALSIVRDLAEPTLVRIASGERPEVGKVRSLEAALRDYIRGSALTIEPLVGALKTARERGADIVVLDDLGGITVPAAELTRAARWAAMRITETTATSITIRIAIFDERPTVTISRDGEAVDRLVLTAEPSAR